MIPVILKQRFECCDGCIEDMMLPMDFPALVPVGSDVHVPLKDEILELTIKGYCLLASGHLQVECRSLIGNEFLPLNGTVTQSMRDLFDAGFQRFDGREMQSAVRACRTKPTLSVLGSV